jgi:hypothetical protein
VQNEISETVSVRIRLPPELIIGKVIGQNMNVIPKLLKVMDEAISNGCGKFSHLMVSSNKQANYATQSIPKQQN